MKARKDYLKNDIVPGDRVIFATGGYKSSSYLDEGVIEKFTPQSVRIKNGPLVHSSDCIKKLNT